MDKRPYIAIPLGDPAGIGPEIAVKASLEQEVLDVCRPVLVGRPEIVQSALKISGLKAMIETEDPFKKIVDGHTLRLCTTPGLSLDHISMGKVQAVCGQAAYDCIAHSVNLALTGKVAAIATTTISKESLLAAGIHLIGHTEILTALVEQTLDRTFQPLTLFETGPLRISFLSRHLSLRQAIDFISVDSISSIITLTNSALQKLGISRPHLAVAGLNPHCSEQGRFGDEESRFIIPGIQRARAQGMDVEGPIGADSVFYMARQGGFDGVISLYHDQGHIAAKTYDFDRTISLTLGLPFLRTSVDHGTAFDIAGKGIARHISMVTAIMAAARYTSSSQR